MTRQWTYYKAGQWELKKVVTYRMKMYSKAALLQ